MVGLLVKMMNIGWLVDTPILRNIQILNGMRYSSDCDRKWLTSLVPRACWRRWLVVVIESSLPLGIRPPLTVFPLTIVQFLIMIKLKSIGEGSFPGSLSFLTVICLLLQCCWIPQCFFIIPSHVMRCKMNNQRMMGAFICRSWIELWSSARMSFCGLCSRIDRWMLRDGSVKGLWFDGLLQGHRNLGDLWHLWHLANRCWLKTAQRDQLCEISFDVADGISDGA